MSLIQINQPLWGKKVTKNDLPKQLEVEMSKAATAELLECTYEGSYKRRYSDDIMDFCRSTKKK